MTAIHYAQAVCYGQQNKMSSELRFALLNREFPIGPDFSMEKIEVIQQPTMSADVLDCDAKNRFTHLVLQLKRIDSEASLESEKLNSEVVTSK